MSANFRRNAKLVSLLLAIIIAFLLLAKILLPPNYAKGDFIQFWVAGKMSLQGQNPYDSVDWVDMRVAHGNSWIPNKIFIYPLPLARLLAPLGLLPLYPAFLVWDVLTLTYLFLIVVLLLGVFRIPPDLKWLAPILVGIFILRPTIVVLRNGQITGLIIFATFIGIYLIDKGKPFWGGMVLGLSMLKPQIGMGLILFMGFWTLIKRNWSFLLGLSVMELALWFVGYLHDPSWVRKFLVESADKVGGYSSYTPSLWGFMDFIFKGHPWFSNLAAIGSFIICCFILIFFLARWKNSLSALDVVSMVLPIVLIVTPYLWSYDHLVLVIPLMLVTCKLVKMGKPYLLAAMVLPVSALFSILLLLLAASLEKDIFAVFFPIIVFGLTLLLNQPAAQEAPKSARLE